MIFQRLSVPLFISVFFIIHSAFAVGHLPLVDTADDLAWVCTKIQSRPDIKDIAVDCEFIKGKLCLIQLFWGEPEEESSESSEDSETMNVETRKEEVDTTTSDIFSHGVLIDYIALHVEKNSSQCTRHLRHALGPLLDIFRDPTLTKVFFAPSRDLDLIYGLTGCLPQSIADAQIMYAATTCNPQASYGKVVEAILGGSVDKSEQTSSWETRPLSKDQLVYASYDVIYLHKLYAELCSRIDACGRTPFIQEYFERNFAFEICISESNKFMSRLYSKAKAMTLNKEGITYQEERLRALANWRKRNKPRLGGRSLYRTLNIETLIRLSCDETILNDHKYQPYRTELQTLLSNYPMITEDITPSVDEKLAENFVMKLVRQRSTELSVAQPLLAKRREVRDTLRGQTSILLKGARAKLLGNKIQSFFTEYAESRAIPDENTDPNIPPSEGLIS